MPMLKKDNITECVATGRTLLTVLLNGRASDLAALEEHPHWPAFKEPGHLRELDAGCVEFLGLNAELAEHLRHHWPPSGLDAAHRTVVNAILDRVPIYFTWMPARGSSASIVAGDAGGRLDVGIFSPVPVKEPVLV